MAKEFCSKNKVTQLTPKRFKFRRRPLLAKLGSIVIARHPVSGRFELGMVCRGTDVEYAFIVPWDVELQWFRGSGYYTRLVYKTLNG